MSFQIFCCVFCFDAVFSDVLLHFLFFFTFAKEVEFLVRFVYLNVSRAVQNLPNKISKKLSGRV